MNETAKIQIFRLFPTTYAKIKRFWRPILEKSRFDVFERERSSAFQVTVCVLFLFLFFLFSDLSIHKQLKRPSLPSGVRCPRVRCPHVSVRGLGSGGLGSRGLWSGGQVSGVSGVLLVIQCYWGRVSRGQGSNVGGSGVWRSYEFQSSLVFWT